MLIEEPIKVIDSQLKEIENKKKEEKANEIEKIYYETIGIYEELVPLNKIFNSKWLNSTYKLNDITSEIKEVRAKLESGLQIIEGLHSEFEQQIKDKFFETLDISKALQENTRLRQFREKQKVIEQQKEKQVKAFLEQQAKETQNQKVKVEQQKIEEEQQQIEERQLEQQSTENLQVLDFRVWVTSMQKMLLKEFLVENNIKYGRVK